VKEVDGEAGGVGKRRWHYTSPPLTSKRHSFMHIPSLSLSLSLFCLTYTYAHNTHTYISTSPLVNLTNHTYWNLSGNGKRDIKNHCLFLDCPVILPVDDTQIPTGEFMSVRGNEAKEKNGGQQLGLGAAKGGGGGKGSGDGGAGNADIFDFTSKEGYGTPLGASLMAVDGGGTPWL